MSIYVSQEYQQFAFFYPNTPFFALPPDKQKEVENSFEGFYRREILPLIPLDIAKKLYSDKNNVRPAKNIKEVIGAILYIKVTGISEAFFLKHIHGDGIMQYALGTEEMYHQPFCRETFKRFRRKIREYDEKNKADIWEEITKAIDLGIAKKMGILDKRFSFHYASAYRIDSMMVDGYGAIMTRLQIIYTTIQLAVKVAHNLGCEEYIPRELSHYLSPRDHNRLLYYKGRTEEVELECLKNNIDITQFTKEDKTESSEKDSSNAEDKKKKRLELIAILRLNLIVKEIPIAIKMLETLGLPDIKEYQLLTRLLVDQTKLDKDGKLIPKNNKEILGSSMQNPFDSDETYRGKNHKGFHGYSGFFAELFTSDGYGVIVERYFEQNIYSDQTFAERFYSSFPDSEQRDIAVCADALFTSHSLKGLASSKGIDIFCASTTGRPVDKVLADFILKRDGISIDKCPCGYNPQTSQFSEKDGGIITFKFKDNCCENCVNCKACEAKTGKRGISSAKLSLNKYNAAVNIKMLSDPVFRDMVNKRNAVEGIPSTFRRAYDIDDNAYPGRSFAAYNFYSSCTAFNVERLYKWENESSIDTFLS